MFTKESRAAVKNFMSKSDEYRALIPQAPLLKADAAVAEATDTGEVKRYFSLNQTGNIMVSSTADHEKDLDDDVKALFKKTTVFFGALTAAVTKKKTDLYDYNAIKNILNKSGFFVQLHEEDRDFKSGAASLRLDTAILSSVLSGFASMGGTTSLALAQMVIGNMGSQLKLSVSGKRERESVGHLLFVCENMMGMPTLTVMLFNTTAKQTETATSSNCHESITKTVSIAYHQATFLFIDPLYIEKFTNEFKSNPDYEALIDKLASYI